MDVLTATDLAAADDRAGGKAAGLAVLIAAGLPVPPGIVLDARGAPVGTLAMLAAAAVRTQGWSAVAVRSSGRDEDGTQASAAGAYATVLNVPADDVVALAQAISTVVRSMADAAAGVIVQRMVPADAAGVAFTVDPFSGNRCVVVNAVAGLGDALVSGVATPWEARLARGPGESVTLPEDVDGPVDRDVLGEVARLAIAAEAARGCPQDVEWAVADGVVWLVQSRPVTALADQIPVEVVVPPGYWVRDPTHGRLPRTRMTSSVVDENVASRPMVEESGALATFQGAVIGGWHYVTVVPVGAPPPAPGKAPPALPGWLVSLLVRTSRAGRRQLRAARRAMATDAAGRLLREWDTRLRDEQRARILAYQDVDLGELDDAELAAQLRARAETMRRSAELHFLLGLPYEFGIHRLVVLCRQHLSWSPDHTLQLLSGLADVASEPARELAAIAALPEDSAERAEAREIPAILRMPRPRPRGRRAHARRVAASARRADHRRRPRRGGGPRRRPGRRTCRAGHGRAGRPAPRPGGGVRRSARECGAGLRPARRQCLPPDRCATGRPALRRAGGGSPAGSARDARPRRRRVPPHAGRGGRGAGIAASGR